MKSHPTAVSDVAAVQKSSIACFSLAPVLKSDQSTPAHRYDRQPPYLAGSETYSKADLTEWNGGQPKVSATLSIMSLSRCYGTPQYIPFKAIKGKAIEMQSYARHISHPLNKLSDILRLHLYRDLHPRIMFSVTLHCGHWRHNPHFNCSLQRMSGGEEIFCFFY